MHASAAWYGGLEAITMIGLAGGVLLRRITTDAGGPGVAAGGPDVAGHAGLRHRASVLVLVPLSVLAGVATECERVRGHAVMTRTEERMRAACGGARAVLNTASVGSLAAGGALAAVLHPGRSTCWPARWAAPSPPTGGTVAERLGLPHQYFVRY